MRYYHYIHTNQRRYLWTALYIFADGRSWRTYMDIHNEWFRSLGFKEESIRSNGAVRIPRCAARKLLKSWGSKLELPL